MKKIRNIIIVAAIAIGILSIQPAFSRTRVVSEASKNLTLQKIEIEWQAIKPVGTIEVSNGKLLNIKILKGKGRVTANKIEFFSNAETRILITLVDVCNKKGSDATLVTINTRENPFSFFLRDVQKDYPIYIPDYHVFVTESGDSRTYAQLSNLYRDSSLLTKYQEIEKEAEYSFSTAAERTRNQPCPTWLGISRDMRIFVLSDSRSDPTAELNSIIPRNSSSPVYLPELNNAPLEFAYGMGRGQGVELNLVRRLEDGVIPILHSTLTDEDIEYHSTIFVSNEKSPLTVSSPKGTDFLVADNYSGGHMFTSEQKEMLNNRLLAEKNKLEETVLYGRVEAINKSKVPRYAWLKTIRFGVSWWKKVNYTFNSLNGFSSFQSGNVYAISKLNGLPLPNEEMAILLKPGEKAVLEFVIPHSPVSAERAVELSKQSFDARFEECRNFWKAKLKMAAQINVPEPRINEMIQAGLLHLDLTTYGNDPGETLAPAIGVYSPIGTESSPIIQFYNSMGLSDISKRSLMYFLDKQHADGMIQNFGGYMVETGAALWSMGEYFRYTKDTNWVRLVENKLLKSCDFLLQWRNKNKKEELRNKGYGMIDGKVADPEDPFHQYMLNAYAYIGISRVAEMLEGIDSANSSRLFKEAEEWKKDIRASLSFSIAHAPVVPLGDGTWCPTVPPWTEAIGLRALHLINETFFSHGTVTAPDVLLGPLYLVFCEVLAPDDPISKMMLNYHSELFYLKNAAFSQPYYSRHNWVQLKLGMVKPFLKTYYNTFSALADRETYSFWEHIYHVSAHKTHEEGWFLMETRWMLYLEQGQTLKLLPGIPREWMKDGKQIELKNVASYYGLISLNVNSKIAKGFIEASVECPGDRKPDQIILRIPHPENKRPVKVIGGLYDEESESVTIKPFNGSAKIKLTY